MVVVCLFFEVFQSVQRLWAFLNLVEDHQRFLRQDFCTGNHGQKLNNAIRIFIRFKDGSQLILFVKVKIDIAFVAAMTELLHQPCFTNLSCAAHNHRLAILAGFPFYQLLNCVSLQVNHSLRRGCL